MNKKAQEFAIETTGYDISSLEVGYSGKTIPIIKSKFGNKLNTFVKGFVKPICEKAEKEKDQKPKEGTPEETKWKSTQDKALFLSDLSSDALMVLDVSIRNVLFHKDIIKRLKESKIITSDNTVVSVTHHDQKEVLQDVVNEIIKLIN